MRVCTILGMSVLRRTTLRSPPQYRHWACKKRGWTVSDYVETEPRSITSRLNGNPRRDVPQAAHDARQNHLISRASARENRRMQTAISEQTIVDSFCLLGIPFSSGRR